MISRIDDYNISFSVISIPAGLSHRLKPARSAALAVEKVTAGRLLSGEQVDYQVPSLRVLVLSLLGEQVSIRRSVGTLGS